MSTGNSAGNRFSLFTSSREQRWWLWALAVITAIYATLFMGRPLANQLRDQNVQAVFFLAGLVLVAAAVVVYGLRTRPGKRTWAVILGISAVYTMLIFRLGAPERSHLIEYSVLAIFIHAALRERWAGGGNPLRAALTAGAMAFGVGILDEGLQFFLPNRTFDPEDIVFNGMAVSLAIAASVLLHWTRRRWTKQRGDRDQ